MTEDGPPLPPLRLRRGGTFFDTDEKFVEGGKRDARLLESLLGLKASSRILDFGCGAGRLAVGMVYSVGVPQHYVGVDVQADAIAWATGHLASRYPGMSFRLSDSYNRRYNEDGTGWCPMPVAARSMDIVYAYSVFSHMTGDEVAFYLQDFARVLAPSGKAFFTAFVETNVELEAENPRGYGSLVWQGPMHCMRFDRVHFRRMIENAGLRLEVEGPAIETDGQRHFIVRNGA